MSASDSFESDLLKLIFNNTTIATLGDTTGVVGSGTAGSVYVALHTADPGETGTQSTNEIAYTGYARVAVARSTGGWTVSGTSPTQAANAAAVGFPACTGGSGTATYFSVGYASTGSTKIIVSGALTSSLAISNGITPSFAIGALTSNCD